MLSGLKQDLLKVIYKKGWNSGDNQASVYVYRDGHAVVEFDQTFQGLSVDDVKPIAEVMEKYGLDVKIVINYDMDTIDKVIGE